MKEQKKYRPKLSHTLVLQHTPELNKHVFVDNRSSHLLETKNKNNIQRVRIGTNVECPSWGNNLTLGSHIHGLFQTQFLNGAVPFAPAPIPNREVERQHGGTYADLAEITPGGWGYGEIKSNNPFSVGVGRGQMAGFAPIPHPGLNIPLNAVDPNAPAQNAAMTIYNQVHTSIGAVIPAPAPGTIPDVQLYQDSPGVFVYDAW
ncbi:hypothetical protein [Parabacteroides timonensis]|uniref:hypothetical protein n=1 Tax=Parabacteroides timonensis TaxID=1871013 RepID=UPI00094ECA96|nr:hypothetical protein [Parabacteroides timonensis]